MSNYTVQINVDDPNHFQAARGRDDQDMFVAIGFNDPEAPAIPQGAIYQLATNSVGGNSCCVSVPKKTSEVVFIGAADSGMTPLDPKDVVLSLDLGKDIPYDLPVEKRNELVLAMAKEYLRGSMIKICF